MTDIHEPEEEERIILDVLLTETLMPPGEHHAKVEEHSVGAPQCPDGQEHHTSVHVGLLIINPTITVRCTWQWRAIYVK